MKRIILPGMLTLVFGVMSIAPAEDEVYVPIVPSIDDASTPPVEDLTIVPTEDVSVGQCLRSTPRCQALALLGRSVGLVEPQDLTAACHGPTHKGRGFPAAKGL